MDSDNCGFFTLPMRQLTLFTTLSLALTLLISSHSHCDSHNCTILSCFFLVFIRHTTTHCCTVSQLFMEFYERKWHKSTTTKQSEKVRGAEHSSSMGDLMTFDNVRDRILIKFGIWMGMPLERIMDLKLSLKHESIFCFSLKNKFYWRGQHATIFYWLIFWKYYFLIKISQLSLQWFHA